MWSRKSPLYACLCALLFAATTASATVMLVTDRGQISGFLIDFAPLGPAFTPVPQSFQISYFGGEMNGSLAKGPGERVDEGNGWTGNFSIGDHLLWTTGNGPLTLAFTFPASAVGAQIQTNSYGSFTAEIQAFQGNRLLGTFTEAGNSNGNEDGSAIFIGVMGGPQTFITSIELSIVSCSGNCADFAINQVSYNPFEFTDIPEPISAMLLGSGLLSLAVRLKARSRGRL